MWNSFGHSLTRVPGRASIACIGFLMLLVVTPACLAEGPLKLTPTVKAKMDALKKKLSTSELECINSFLAGETTNNLGQFGPKSLSPGQVGYIDKIFQVAEIIDDQTALVNLSQDGGRPGEPIEPELGISFVLKGFSTKPYIVGSKWYGTEKKLVMIRKSDELKDPRLPKATMVIEAVTNPAFAEALALLAPKPPKKRR